MSHSTQPVETRLLDVTDYLEHNWSRAHFLEPHWSISLILKSHWSRAQHAQLIGSAQNSVEFSSASYYKGFPDLCVIWNIRYLF